MDVLGILLYVVAFVAIWVGTGLCVSTVDNLARHLKISQFSISFFVLGMLTSLPEIGLSITAAINNRPDIYAGNLIGATVVLFFLIIPIFALAGKGLNVGKQLSRFNLLYALIVVLMPVTLILDGKVTLIDSLIMVLVYALLFYFIEKDKGLLNLPKEDHVAKEFSLEHIGKMVVGITLVIFSARYILAETIIIAETLGISPFVITFFGVSIGTNLPEIFLGIRSVLSGKRAIAFGDYVGSAAVNTLIFGAVTLFDGKDTVVAFNFFGTFVLMTAGLGVFYLFARSKEKLSASEALILLMIYGLFIAVETIL